MRPLSGKSILCLATQAWDAHWTPVQQVMLRLTPQNRVIYFEPFHPPFAWLKRSQSLLRKQRDQRVPQLREVQPNLLVFRPSFPYAPLNMKVPFAAAFNGRLYKSEIRRLLARLRIQKPWLWAFFAQSLSVLELPFEHFIYDCVDDWPSFFPDPREKRFVARIDEAMCRRAELVFVGSEPLKEKKAAWNAKTFVVTHAADVGHFAKAADPDTVVPAELEHIPHPRIGFVGMVDEIRFHSELVAQLAANPRNQIVIVGGFVGKAAGRLPRLQNLHHLGMKPVSELPAYLKGMDVCLMPYRINEATRNIYPLKLHEYLATGKPVVATAIPAVDGFRDLIYVADREEDFAGLVSRALEESDPTRMQRRRDCARQHNWEAHVEKKMELIRQHLLTA